jgi:hypothetical protein
VLEAIAMILSVELLDCQLHFAGEEAHTPKHTHSTAILFPLEAFPTRPHRCQQECCDIVSSVTLVSPFHHHPTNMAVTPRLNKKQKSGGKRRSGKFYDKKGDIKIKSSDGVSFKLSSSRLQSWVMSLSIADLPRSTFASGGDGRIIKLRDPGDTASTLNQVLEFVINGEHVLNIEPSGWIDLIEFMSAITSTTISPRSMRGSANVWATHSAILGTCSWRPLP